MIPGEDPRRKGVGMICLYSPVGMYIADFGTYSFLEITLALFTCLNWNSLELKKGQFKIIN